MSTRLDPQALERAIRWAEDRYSACDVCAERCGVDRYAGPTGKCRLGVGARVYKEYLHLGEERALVPSHTIYLSGCNLRCVFCSDMLPVTRPHHVGVEVPPAALAARIAQRRREGAINVNFVGGLPDVNVLYILRVLQHCPEDTHVVWNTNLWTTAEAIARLEGVVGTWLADFKFGQDECAARLAGVSGYVARLTDLLPRAAAAGELVVRHLLMQGHLECCTVPVLRWLHDELPGTRVNLMTGYHPFKLAGQPGPLGAGLRPAEREAAVASARALYGEALWVDGQALDDQAGAEATATGPGWRPPGPPGRP